MLCTQCIEQIKQFYVFKETCQQADVFLRQYISEINKKQLEVPNPIDLELEKTDIYLIDPETYNCTVCNETFDLQNDLDIHMIGHPDDDDQLTCTKCQKKFLTVKNLKRHVKIHMTIKPHKCKNCSRSFADRGGLTKHARKHVGDKRHLCPICGKSFYEANVLAVHIRTHTGRLFHN